MSALLTGITAYIVAGVISLIHPRRRFWISLLGWAGGLVGLIQGIWIHQKSGTQVFTLGEWGKLGVEFKLDETTLLFAGLVVVLNLFTLLYLRKTKEGTFYALYNFLLVSTYSMAFSHDLFNIYVTIEFMSLVAILLIGYGRKAYQIYAGIKYLLVSSLAMSLYLIGLGLVYRGGGHLSIAELEGAIEGEPEFTLSLGLSLMIAGLAVKGGIMLFSMWLPDAHGYSGTVVSALLSGLAIKSGLVGVIRLAELVSWGNLWLFLGSLTGITGGIFALLGRRPKRILAYSTISQIGYVLLGIGAGTSAGIMAAGLNIFFHGLFKSLLFLSVGHAGVGNRDVFSGESLSVPTESIVGLSVGTLSILAIPPFSKYFSKAFLIESSSQEWITWIMLLIGLGTAAYIIKLDWALLVKSRRGPLRRGGWPIIAYSFCVGVSGLVAWLVLGSHEMSGLLSLHHIALYLSLPLAGLLVFLVLRNKLGKVKSPRLPFNLDNALTSVFTGFLFIELALFVFGL